jgi:hypothetical protein
VYREEKMVFSLSRRAIIIPDHTSLLSRATNNDGLDDYTHSSWLDIVSYHAHTAGYDMDEAKGRKRKSQSPSLIYPFPRSWSVSV